MTATPVRNQQINMLSYIYDDSWSSSAIIVQLSCTIHIWLQIIRFSSSHHLVIVMASCRQCRFHALCHLMQLIRSCYWLCLYIEERQLFSYVANQLCSYLLYMIAAFRHFLTNFSRNTSVLLQRKQQRRMRCTLKVQQVEKRSQNTEFRMVMMFTKTHDDDTTTRPNQIQLYQMTVVVISD